METASILVTMPRNLRDGTGLSSHFTSECFVIIMIPPQTFGITSINPAFLSQVGKQGQMTCDWMLWIRVRNETPSKDATFWYLPYFEPQECGRMLDIHVLTWAFCL